MHLVHPFCIACRLSPMVLQKLGSVREERSLSSAPPSSSRTPPVPLAERPPTYQPISPRHALAAVQSLEMPQYIDDCAAVLEDHSGNQKVKRDRYALLLLFRSQFSARGGVVIDHMPSVHISGWHAGGLKHTSSGLDTLTVRSVHGVPPHKAEEQQTGEQSKGKEPVDGRPEKDAGGAVCKGQREE